MDLNLSSDFFEVMSLSKVWSRHTRMKNIGGLESLTVAVPVNLT
jgi:hypothetical protein